MPVLVTRKSHTHWYDAVPGHVTRDLASEAYHDAIKLLQAEVRTGFDSNGSMENLASINDVYKIVEKARQKYTNKSTNHTGGRQWLEKLSERIMHYAPVLDALAQHHPEYVALAWGSVKLVLMGIINRATLVEELSKALVAIGDVLPRAHLSVELYQTADMKAALSRLYTCLIMFFHLCVRWYNQNSWGRLWSSLKNPFELKYKDLVADIESCSTLVEGLANGGARVEIRDIHVLSELDHTKLTEIDAKLEKVYDGQKGQLTEINANVLRLSDRQATLETQMIQMLQIATLNRSLIERVNGGVQNMRQCVFGLEFHRVVQSFTPKILPDAALLKVQPLARRSPTLSLVTRDKLKLEGMLREWASSNRGFVLVLQAEFNAQKQATELAADIVKYLLANGQCVFWNISSGLRSKHRLTMIDIFKSLIFQTLRHSGSLYTELSEQLNLSKVQSLHTEQEWVDLLYLLFTKLPRVFVVIETHDVYKTGSHDRKWNRRLVELLKSIVDRSTVSGSQVKIVLILYGDKVQLETEESNNKDMLVASLKSPSPIPPRLKRLACQSSFSTRGWNLQKSKT